METLRSYLNSISVADQSAYAVKCGTTIGYLRKAISVNQRLDAALARHLDLHSLGAVRKELLRPDVWPELLQKDVA